ncbi:MAG: hypothetical protein QOJ74_897 [Ilumatobacteraceae bacterium]|jgi:hypothetical protein|nr:hypothetical protein [Ilumatobacteraceae bacterium]
MINKDHTFDLGVAYAAVALDTAGVLGSFLDGRFVEDDSIGASTWQAESSEFFAVRWRFEGRHLGPIPGFGHTFIAATGNEVSVSGLTLVENLAPGKETGDDLDALLRSGTVVFHRFIDWLAVFAQIGMLHLGRPMSISEIHFVPPDRGMSRRPGYNDESP